MRSEPRPTIGPMAGGFIFDLDVVKQKVGSQELLDAPKQLFYWAVCSLVNTHYTRIRSIGVS